MSISSMRSKKTSRYKAQHPDEIIQTFDNTDQLSTTQYDNEDLSDIQSANMMRDNDNINENQDFEEDDKDQQQKYRVITKVSPINLLWAEKGAELILVYLDKYEVQNMKQVSQSWYNQVSSFTLFSTIIKSLREVVEESKEKDTKQVKTRQQRLAEQLPDENKEYTSSREIQQAMQMQQRKGGNSRFSQRFNMMGTNAQIIMSTPTSTTSTKLNDPSRQLTPSTTTSEISVDENQWIKRPPLQSIYDPSKAEDPQELYQKLSSPELGTIQDYVNLWSKNIQTLLDKLKDTIPGEGMIGEVHYWRDMARILEAINAEVKQNYVEISMQVLANSDDKTVMSSLEKFTKEKSRVIQGAKEARWNNKYMKVIEKPVQQIEQARELKDIQLVIVILLKSLKNIYENSNFYKEARIVSFIDRLMETIISKIRTRINIPQAIQRGSRDYENFQQELQQAQTVIQKFQENFWVRELMQNNREKLMSQDTNQSNQNPMNQSFYSKNGLDFLYFARPGTAYGPNALQNSSLGMIQTTSGFYDSKTQSVKPIEMINSKKNTPKLITQMWVDRAEKIIKQLDHMNKLMDFLSYASLISYRISKEYIPGLKEEKNKLQKLRKNDLIREMKQMLELYQAYQLEYDYFDHKNQTTFSYFIEKFETKAQELENRFTKLTTAYSDRDNQSQVLDFNSTQQSFQSSFKLGEQHKQDQELNQKSMNTTTTSLNFNNNKTQTCLQPLKLGTKPLITKGGKLQPLLPTSLAPLKSSHLQGLAASGGLASNLSNTNNNDSESSSNTNRVIKKSKTLAQQIEEYKQSDLYKNKNSNNDDSEERKEEKVEEEQEELRDDLEEEENKQDMINDEEDEDTESPFMCSASWKIS